MTGRDRDATLEALQGVQRAHPQPMCEEGAMPEYEVLEEYVHAARSDIDQGNPVVVEVRDNDTFERLVVRALIVPPGQDAAGADRLLLRNLAENVSADDWAIRIVERLDPESVDIRPVSDYRKQGGEG